MFKKILRNRNFLLLSSGGFISTIGDYLYNIGLVVYIYNSTGSVQKSIGAVSLMWLARAALRIPVQYIAGIIADRFNKKTIMLLTNFISVPIALSLIFINRNMIWIGYMAAFMLQSLDDIDVCSENSILPQLVSKEELSYANSVFSFLSSTCVFLSPAIGGILYSIYGSKVLFIVNAVTFLIAGLLFSLIRYNHVDNEAAPSKRGMLADGIEGYKILGQFKNVKTVFLIMTGFAVMGRFYEIFKTAVSDVLLGMKPQGIIYFDYALAVGGLLVPLMIKGLSKYREVTLFAITSALIAIAYIGFGYSKSMFITLGILIVLGFLQNLQGLYSRTIIQKTIPQGYIGRVFSVYKIVLTIFAIIGILVTSLFYRMFGMGNSFSIIAIVCFILCTVYFIGERKRKLLD